MSTSLPTYRYLGLDELADETHVMVDGAARANTTTVLSHWASSATPNNLAGDVSAEITRAYLLDESIWDHESSTVTCDHLDIDGLISLCFLTDPSWALDHADLLIDVARAGDFGTVASSEVAQIAWTLEALMESPDLAQVAMVDSAVTHEGAMTHSYRALLSVLERIVNDPDSYSSLTKVRRMRFDTTVNQIKSGAISLEEISANDLCVVRVDKTLALSDPITVGNGVHFGIDPWAIHSATAMPRIFLSHDARYVYYDRYETWVRYMSRHLQQRRDLAGIAMILSGIDNVTWHADPPGSLEPVLHHEGARSALAEEVVISQLVDYLDHSPPAWDPFNPRQPLN